MRNCQINTKIQNDLAILFIKRMKYFNACNQFINSNLWKKLCFNIEHNFSYSNKLFISKKIIIMAMMMKKMK